MNSIERIQSAISFGNPDRVPVIAQVFGHAAVLAGKSLGDYVRSADIMVRCQIKALERYGYDAVFALMDANVETEAAGSALAYRLDQYPVVKTYAVSRNTDITHLSIPNPNRDARMPELLKAVRLLRQEVGEEILVVGCVLGPMTLATQLMGIEKTLYLAADAPEAFTRLIDFAAEVAIGFGVAQIEAGAHLSMVFDPSSSPAVIPPQFYREFVFPRLQRLFAALKIAGALANWLHTAGPIVPVLPIYPQAQVDIANFDYCVDPFDAMQAAPFTCLNGNVKPLSFVEESPDAIADASLKLLDNFGDRGGFILSSGCEIPLESNPENIAAMVFASRREG